MTDPAILNIPELLSRLGGSRTALVELARLLTQSAQTWKSELSTALADADAERLRRAAHQAKGALLTFAAPRAADAAHQIEWIAKSGDLTAAAPALTTFFVELQQVEAAARPLDDSLNR